MLGGGFNYSPQISLLEDISEQMNYAIDSVHALQNYANYVDSLGNFCEEYEDADEVFASTIKTLHLSMCLLLESLNFPLLLDDFKSGFSEYSARPTYCEVTRDGDFYSPAISYFWRFHKVVSALINKESTVTDESKQRVLFEAILRNTPKILLDRKIIPSSEADVRKCVYEILIHVFPDTMREIPIPQVTKTYKADLGVPSLKVAAEYKYATSEDEAKTIVGGFYEDMRGCSGSKDWKYFYAVLFMSQPFFTVEQIKAEFAHVGADKNWAPILVHGEGTRKRAKI